MPSPPEWSSGPAFALAAAIAIPVGAGIAAYFTWDEAYLMVPAAWLVAAVAVVALGWGTTAGWLAATVASLMHVLLFIPPTWSLRLDRWEDVRATMAIVVITATVVVTVHVMNGARRQAVNALGDRDELLERISRLQRVTAALGAARTTDDLVEVVIHDVRRITGADAASLCVVEGDELVVRGAHGYPTDTVAAYLRIPLDAPLPLAEACRTGRVITARSLDEMRQRWPDVADRMSFRGIAALPLVVEGRPLGSIGLSFAHANATGHEEVGFLIALAGQCSDALLRARLYDAERSARRASEAAAERLAFLAAASSRLNASLDLEDTLHQITAMAVPTLADWCAIYLGDDRGQLTLLASSGPPPDETVRDMAAQAMATDSPSLSSDDAAGSLVVAPMRATGREVGAIALGTVGGRRLVDDDLAVATELAQRSGQAVVNAHLFREREQVANTLQRSLLPPTTPLVPGLEIATRFHALGHGVDVGGDFFDVVRLGRPSSPLDCWAVVIGDVRGKGPDAAAVTGAARHAIRAYALDHRSPATMLSSLNDLLLVMSTDGLDDDPRFCTAAVAVVEPGEGAARITVAVAGHPAPLILRHDGSVEVVDAPGALLGVLADSRIEDRVIALEHGDSLVLYTDGITERHEGDRFFDEDGLIAVVSRCAGFTADVLAERIETTARAFVDEAPRDDLAIVVVRVPQPTAVATTAVADLPADTTAPGRARRFVAAALETYGLDELLEVAVLLTSEVVTNAVTHGGGRARIAVEQREAGVRVSVSDASPDRPLRLDLGLEATSGRGVHLLDRLSAHWGVDPTPEGKAVWFELALPA